MRLAVSALGLVVATACHSQPDDYPVLPGGGGPIGGTPVIDAPIVFHDGMPVGFVAHVCVLQDPRDPSSCLGTGVGNLAVTLGTNSATTADDGSFFMPGSTATGLVWHVTGTAIYPTVQPYGPDPKVFAITTTRYNQLLGDNGVLFVDQQASLFVHVTHANAALVDATIDTTPPSTAAIFYDGTSAIMWDQDKTGTFGTAWVPQLPIGTASVAVTPSGGTAMTTPGIPLENLSLTFATIAL